MKSHVALVHVCSISKCDMSMYTFTGHFTVVKPSFAELFMSINTNRY